MMIKKHQELLVLIIFNAIFSLPLLVGLTDQDYFSFYYIGKGVILGKDMFADFADNKGPVLYIFFAALYSIFKNNYLYALYSSSVLVDTLTVWFAFRFSKNFLAFDSNVKTTSNIFLLVLITVIYKTFAISLSFGSIYSESIAMLFVSSSLYLYSNNKKLASAGLFALAISTRPSVAPFIILIMCYERSKHAKSWIKNIFKFCLTIGSISILLLGIIFIKYDHTAFVNNLFWFNIYKIEPVHNANLIYIMRRVIIQPQSFLVVILVGFTYISMVSNNTFTQLVKFNYALLATLLSLFISNSYYQHHTIQALLLIVAGVLIIFSGRNRIKIIFLIITISFVVINYCAHRLVAIRNQSLITLTQHNYLKNLTSDYQYLQVVQHYPYLYILLDKQSPDRYFQPFQNLKSYNSKPDTHIVNHKNLQIEKLRNTIFVSLIFNEWDKDIEKEYLETYGEALKLVSVYEIKDDKHRLRFFKSDK